VTRLSTRALTRTLWVRQQLVPGRRTVTSADAVVGQVLGLQAQENLPPYLALAARLDDFDPRHLSDLLEARGLVRMLTLRGTVHVLTPEDALRLRGWVQPSLDRVSASNQGSRPARHLTTPELDAVVRPFLSDGPRPLAEIGAHLADAFPGIPEPALRHVVRERLPLLQAPPRGLWKRSGSVTYAYADRFLGRPWTVGDPEDLVVRYLSAYGPATPADMTKWSMVTRLGPVFKALHEAERLVTCTDDHGRTLYDVPGAPVAEEDLPLPARLLGTYDNLFLSHADRDRVATPEALQGWTGANGGAGSTLFLDGLLAGLWRVEDGRVRVEPFRTPTRGQQRELDAEVDRVEALLAR
jgi:hypothetical protein